MPSALRVPLQNSSLTKSATGRSQGDWLSNFLGPTSPARHQGVLSRMSISWSIRSTPQRSVPEQCFRISSRSAIRRDGCPPSPSERGSRERFHVPAEGCTHSVLLSRCLAKPSAACLCSLRQPSVACSVAVCLAVTESPATVESGETPPRSAQTYKSPTAPSAPRALPVPARPSHAALAPAESESADETRIR